MILDEPKPKIKLIDRSPKQYIKRYRLNIVNNDLENHFIATRNIIRETLLKDLTIHKGLKVNTLVNLELKLPTKFLSEIIPGDFYVSTEAVFITSEEDINKFVESRSILEKIDSYKYPASILDVSRLKEHIINIYKYKPLGGASYIELPKEYVGNEGMG